MIAHQLDLFGGPLKPPKKIKVDDEIPVDDAPPVETPVIENTQVDPEPVETISPAVAIEEILIEESSGSGEHVSTNGMEWDPSYGGPMEGLLAEKPVLEEVEEKEEDKVSLRDTQIEEAEVPFTNEAIFTGEFQAAGDFEDAGTTSDEIEEFTSSENDAVDESETVISLEETVAPATAIQATTRTRKLEDEDGLNIPPDEELFKRQYYSMRETSAMFNVNQSLLRFWENEFDILQPRKNKKGDRYFRPADIKNLVMIHHLLRVRKFTMDGAKDYLNSNKKAADSFELVRRLEKLKSFLFELKAGL